MDSTAIVRDALTPALTSTIDEALARAVGYARAEKSEATQDAYWSDFKHFGLWAQKHDLAILPASPEAVAAYLAAQASSGAKPSTLGRRCAGIQYVHVSGKHPNPVADPRVKAVMRGIRRTHGTAPKRTAPATAERVIAMAPQPDGRLATLRDRALLLFGFAGAFRRSELVTLNVEDIEEVAEGLRVTIRRGKTDQEARGAVIAIVRGEIACPVAALQSWLGAASITEGPIFRRIRRGDHVRPERLTDRSVANIVKAHAERVGLDPGLFSGHSLRAGFLTSAARRGATLFKMMATSRHRSVETVTAYVRDQELFQDHAGAGLL
jgi:site-specific recombinase XerD